MHSIVFVLASLRRRKWLQRRAWLAMGWLSLAFLGSTPALPGQTFVAEWSEADIGRVGPVGLALDTVGGVTYLYVADDPNGRILKIDTATGTRVAAWGKVGTGPLEFNAPYGIAVDPVSHDLYVAERVNNRIQRITNTGTFVMGWGTPGTAPGQFSAPIGITADAAGNVYVVDHDNNRIQKFHVHQTSSGWAADFVTTWGSKGSGNGQLDGAYGLTLDPAGVLWVADGRNHRLEKFNTDGTFVGTVGSFGTGDGQFITPTWVNFDPSGACFVAETNSDPLNLSASDISNQRIQKFSPTGVFQYKWGSYGVGNSQFKLPFDAVVDASGNAYVSDYYNTRLLKFSLSGTSTGGPPPPPASTSQFVNVSSRLRVNADRPLIAGFVVSGSTAKQMLIRAVGPTLSQYGVGGPLANPGLKVFAGSTVVASNEDWAGDAKVSAAATSVGAFALPASSKDAAVLVTLQPGAYTAQVADNGGDGIALVEVYDADGSTTGRVINLSTRGYVDTGDGVLVAGFVVKGTVSKKVLIRGVGPTLATFGVSGALADPTLKVYTAANALVAQNDDWGTGQAVAGGPTPATSADITAADTATGAFALPSGSKDSAILVTLQPGAYSAIVSGSGGTTGTALVEVYEIPGQ